MSTSERVYEKEKMKVHEKLKRYSEFKSVKVNTDRIDFDLSNEHVEDLMNQHYQYVDQISSYYFNIFTFSQAVGRNMQMPFIATTLLRQNNLLQVVDHHKFLQFIVQIYNKYKRSVEYHNDLHGSDVA